MTRTFIHSFDPVSSSPVTGPNVDLDVLEIEDAGIREVLQTRGAPYGAWSLLDALLTPTGIGSPFIFREPLGQAREVKVALSGLFGRFVARAYLERYFNLSIFTHLGNSSLLLDGRLKIGIVRLSPGDLPDWVACDSNLSDLTVAEAKGCHDTAGPSKALARAWAQAGRIDVTVRGRRVTVKRIAIATRWGAATSGPANAHLSVRDPKDEGEPIEPNESDALFLGLLRHHVANLIAPLGHGELAGLLRDLTRNPFPKVIEGNIARAKQVLDRTSIHEVVGAAQIDGLVGGLVTRAGPLKESSVTTLDQEVLARLNLRPVFVGLERDLIASAIDGDITSVRKRLYDTERQDDFARFDRAGGWIIPLGPGQRQVRNADRIA
jgi:hypothetical protein